MTGSPATLHCVNPDCSSPRNAIGRDVCANCQSPLVYRYVRAIGEIAAALPIGSLVAGRYQVAAPSIWLDTEPQAFPWTPAEVPEPALPYLRLHRWPLHIPRVYGYCPMGARSLAADVLLLENVPLDRQGQAYPAVTDLWSRAKPLRRLGWLRQLVQLWEPLASQGAVGSLLMMGNLRVQGWRLWLQEIDLDLPEESDPAAQFRKFGALWFAWLAGSLVQVDRPEEQDFAERLQAWLQPIRQGDIEPAEALQDLDFLSLRYQAQRDFSPQVAAHSHLGRVRSTNEDACFPAPPLGQAVASPLAIVCDGIGGHDKGEEASRTAIQSVRLQVEAFLNDLAQDQEPIDPLVAADYLATMIRVANNTIASQNDDQNREARQRMGTTIVAAIALPRPVRPPLVETPATIRELYIVHVGDSRAYWLTAEACQLLTVDDDLAGQETVAGVRPYREGLAQPNGSALFQALGTDDGDAIEPTVLRFIPDEPGLLLLCSDGFSDFDWVEQTWRKYAPIVLAGRATTADAAQIWLEAAIERHGHDNTTIALIECRPAPQYSAIPDPWDSDAQPVTSLAPMSWDAEMSEASKALLYTPAQRSPQPEPIGRRRPPRPPLPKILVIAAIAAVGAAVLGMILGWLLWRSTPSKVQPVIESPQPDASPRE